MKFEIRYPYIVFSDDKPGEHATLFGPKGNRLRFRGDASHFDNDASYFSWAFEGNVEEGDQIVFATSDREVIGKVKADGEIEAVLPDEYGGVARLHNKPLDLTGNLLPPVKVLMEPPFPESKPRPIRLEEREAARGYTVAEGFWQKRGQSVKMRKPTFITGERLLKECLVYLRAAATSSTVSFDKAEQLAKEIEDYLR